MELTAGDFLDRDELSPPIAEQAALPGMRRQLAGLLGRCAAQLVEAGYPRGAMVRAYWVPGRVEVLGKHTDYAGGRSLLMAAQRGLALLATPRDDATGEAMIAGGGRVSFELRADLQPTQGGWANYPMTVARRLARNFPEPPLLGAAIAAAGDLPPASGMSSSSAMIVGFYLALAGRNGLGGRDEHRANIHSDEQLAEYLSCVENGNGFGQLAGDTGVGTSGGSEDHVAILCCREGLLRQYSFAPVRAEAQVALPAGLTFAIAGSGVTAAKTGGAMASYNRASSAARAAVELWNRSSGRCDPHLAAAMHSGPGAAPKVCQAVGGGDADFTGEELVGRVNQFYLECQMIPRFVELLAGGQIDKLGEVVDMSQRLGEMYLGNQVPQTVALARQARALGAAAASAFGAGFGGSVWALVEESSAAAFLEAWRRDYAGRFPDDAPRAEFFTTRPAGPARCF